MTTQPKCIALLNGSRVFTIGVTSCTFRCTSAAVGTELAEQWRPGAHLKVGSRTEWNLRKLLDGLSRHREKARPLWEFGYTSVVETVEVRFFGVIPTACFALDYWAHDSSLTVTKGSVSHKPTPGLSIDNGFGTGAEGLRRRLVVSLATLDDLRIRFNCAVAGPVATSLWYMAEEEKQGMFKSMTDAAPSEKVPKAGSIAQVYLESSVAAAYCAFHIKWRHSGNPSSVGIEYHAGYWKPPVWSPFHPCRGVECTRLPI
ncbi:hypothetical protein K437DRAFT_296853 [Tilletiaria anomala UBC 951]|uniref:Uncharacterized protein n=1 Tax=Tilletiaria anomala (strain ATCC 24038 / CBS 436.72 / UBC 951) TaxID=1037660 RepID=A0A066V780_TILAU|nr:uncharacterized protein K437DRAFT_296853 [Tilletiaria anomala UBC 951]KDN36143.1 hypothetical protein K437DRAFT_296853 [Tilletiaria anomala UBC 951]